MPRHLMRGSEQLRKAQLLGAQLLGAQLLGAQLLGAQVLGVLVLLVAPNLATAQSRFGDRTVGGGIDSRSAGLTQTGQVTSTGAIDRGDSSFVGSSSDTAGSLRSMSGATSGLGGGLGGQFGLGTNLGAGMTFGSNLIGGGGFGGGMGGFGNQQFGGGRNAGQAGQRAGGSTQLPIRAPIRIGFTQATVSGAVVSSRFTRRLNNLPGIRLTSPVAVTMEDQTAVLQGTVASENDRDLIGRLALLEPGISEVRNELTVVPPTGP